MAAHEPAEMTKTAIISPCGRYRYNLTRQWQASCFSLPFVMLNPSTADADLDDPTIRRCMAFARRDGYGGISVFNLFALRATDPAELRKTSDPFGPENRKHLAELAIRAADFRVPIVCAWGTGGWLADTALIHLLANSGAELLCLGTTQAGHPKHPLYIKGSQPLEPFGGTRAAGEQRKARLAFMNA